MPDRLSQEDISAARARLAGIATDDAVAEALVAVAEALVAAAQALGVASLRASIMALRVARINAALAGLSTLGQDDAAIAARLVLGPPATIAPPLPDIEDEAERPPPEPPRPNDEDEHEATQQQADRPLDDVVLAAAAYFGTKRQFPGVPHHTILLGQRYEALLKDIFDRKVLAEDFSMYLHRPTETDPSLAPEGCDAFYVLSPVPHLDAGIDWRVQAEPYRRAIARRLSETLLPGFEDEVVTSRIMTPQDFQDRLLSYKGAAFGLEPVLSQTAWFRPHNKSEDIENLYLVGAGTHPGAGVPGVLSSARVLDQVVPDAAALVR